MRYDAVTGLNWMSVRAVGKPGIATTPLILIAGMHQHMVRTRIAQASTLAGLLLGELAPVGEEGGDARIG